MTHERATGIRAFGDDALGDLDAVGVAAAVVLTYEPGSPQPFARIQP